MRNPERAADRAARVEVPARPAESPARSCCTSRSRSALCRARKGTPTRDSAKSRTWSRALITVGPCAYSALKVDDDTFTSETISAFIVCVVPALFAISVSDTPSRMVAMPVVPVPFEE